MEKNLIWFRDKIIEQKDAKVSALSPMAQFGLNVFEGVRCYWNEERQNLYAFRLVDHLNRLIQSCKLTSIDPPCTVGEMIDRFRRTIQENRLRTDCAVRITIFVDGEGSWSSLSPTSMFIAPIKKPRTDLNVVPEMNACISSWRRLDDNVMPTRAKVGANYINGRYAHLQALKDGYDLPIFLGQDGKVSEGAGACLFIVRDSVIVTPPTTSSILESITRHTIITIAKDCGMKVSIRSIDRTELYIADEIFLCGTAAEITPIKAVDGFPVGAGRVGAMTFELLSRYLAIVSGQTQSFDQWRTEIIS